MPSILDFAHYSPNFTEHSTSQECIYSINQGIPGDYSSPVAAENGVLLGFSKTAGSSGKSQGTRRHRDTGDGTY